MLKTVSRIESLDKEALKEFFYRLSHSQQKRISNKKKSDEALAARFVLSELLQEYSGEDMTGKIANDDNGRPFIEGRPDIFISISHTKGAVAAAVGERAVGIDIEYIRPVSEKIKVRVCKNIPENDNEFFRVWTIKEAYLKASGITFSDMLSLSIEELDIKTENEIVDGYMLSAVEL